MSRNCEDCSKDGNCVWQKDGCYLGSNGNQKTDDQIFDDLNNKVIDMLLDLEGIRDQYLKIGRPKKAKSVNQIMGTIKTEYQLQIQIKNRQQYYRKGEL